VISKVHMKHLGRVFQKLGDTSGQELPAEFSMLLARLNAISDRELLKCPRCLRADALVITKVADVGQNLDERRCVHCGQVVLELAER
jgi:hypothetical protein